MDERERIEAAIVGGDGDALNDLGIGAGEAGRFDEACRLFRLAVSLGNEEALANLGKAARLNGDAVGAAEALRLAVRAGFSGERVWLGVVLFDELGEEVAGEELLRNAYVEGEPHAGHQLALTMLMTERNDEAIAILDSLPTAERTGDVLDSMSSALRWADRPVEALDAAERAIAAGYEDAHLNRAYALDDLGDPRTEQAHRDNVAMHLDDAEICFAAWLWEQDRRTEAIDALRAAPRTDPSVLIDLSNYVEGADPGSREARLLLRRAMLLGSTDAMTNLANLVETDGDHDTADRLRRQAAAEGDDLAARNLETD